MQDITAKELEARIKEILDYGKVIYSKHVREKMNERNYEIRDVLPEIRKAKTRKV